MSTPQPTEQSLLHELLFGFMAAKTVYAAAELGIVDGLAEGSETSAELADRAGAHGPSVWRLLRALTGLGIVAQTEPDRFELTELGAPLRSHAPDSIQAFLRLRLGPAFWRSWGELVPSVRTGEAAWDLVHGMSWIDYLGRNPDQSATFNRAMAEHTRDAAPGLVLAAELSRFSKIVDIGGGEGTLIAEALRAQPQLEALVFDLPEGLASATATLMAAGVAHRCRMVPGDFFLGVPAGADAYLLKQVLHDWDDERAIAILRNVREAMAPGARVLILERVVPELVGSDDLQTLLLDIGMLVVTGGKERTEEEFRDILHAAGLELARLSERLPPFDYRVIEGVPGNGRSSCRR